MDSVQPAEINIYQSNTYTQDLSWLHYNDKPRREATSEGPTVLYTRFCNLFNIFKKQLWAQAHVWKQYSMEGRMVDL